MTVNSPGIELLLEQIRLTSILFEDGFRLQILDRMSDLPRSRQHHFAAFVREPPSLVVWDDDPGHILGRAQAIKDLLLKTPWVEDEKREYTMIESNEKPPMAEDSTALDLPSARRTNQEDRNSTVSSGQNRRRTVLIQPILTAATLFLLIAAVGGGFRQIAFELKVDRSWMRLTFVAVMPLQFWLGLFFMQTIATCAAQILGPNSQMKANTKFFSGHRPARLSGMPLPHVTIQCPVYKEGLWTVIDPTIRSIEAAISTYEKQGGSANIFINDDGMQHLDEKEAEERQVYYDEHTIGWTARPRHGSKLSHNEGVFIRAGKFKKASNMNYALNVSVRVEEKLRHVERSLDWNQNRENEAYNNALTQVLDEDAGLTLAKGNIRIGDYILLIDSDTRVPADCFLDAVSEMELSPSCHHPVFLGRDECYNLMV